MEQAKAIGRSLVDDSKPEESQKVTGRLEALTTQFRQLESVAQTRMARLEAALKCAAAYEDEGSEFNQWLVDAEGRLGSLEQLAISSQPLKQQLEDVKVHVCFDVHAFSVYSVAKQPSHCMYRILPRLRLP